MEPVDGEVREVRRPRPAVPVERLAEVPLADDPAGLPVDLDHCVLGGRRPIAADRDEEVAVRLLEHLVVEPEPREVPLVDRPPEQVDLVDPVRRAVAEVEVPIREALDPVVVEQVRERRPAGEVQYPADGPGGVVGEGRLRRRALARERADERELRLGRVRARPADRHGREPARHAPRLEVPLDPPHLGAARVAEDERHGRRRVRVEADDRDAVGRREVVEAVADLGRRPALPLHHHLDRDRHVGLQRHLGRERRRPGRVHGDVEAGDDGGQRGRLVGRRRRGPVAAGGGEDEHEEHDGGSSGHGRDRSARHDTTATARSRRRPRRPDARRPGRREGSRGVRFSEDGARAPHPISRGGG